MMQGVVVGLLVASSSVYALNQLMPEALRRWLLGRLLQILSSTPGLAPVATRLRAMRPTPGGCGGCSGCGGGRSAAAPAPALPASLSSVAAKPLVFHPHTRRTSDEPGRAEISVR